MVMCCLIPVLGRAENIAVTFDDLPLNGGLAPHTTRVDVADTVLAVLKKYRVPQVYGFVNAGELEDNPDAAAALQRWIAGGQRVGNHTYSHADLNAVTADGFLQDIRLDEPVLELLGGGDTWRWFRYPYLHEGDSQDKRREVRTWLRGHGYRIAQVTVSYHDYLWNDAYARCSSTADAHSIDWLRSSYLAAASQTLDFDRRISEAVFGHDISQVLLLHLGAFSGRILPDLFDLLRRKGFTLVTLEAAQRDPAYDFDPDAGSRDGGTLLEQGLQARSFQSPQAPQIPLQQLDAICR